MFKALPVILLLFATPAFADECTYDADGNRYSCASPGATPSTPPPPRWHLFTQSNGGTISLLHGLTKSTCEYAMNRALGRPVNDEEREIEKNWRAHGGGGVRVTGPGDIMRAECFE